MRQYNTFKSTLKSMVTGKYSNSHNQMMIQSEDSTLQMHCILSLQIIKKVFFQTLLRGILEYLRVL